MKIETLSLTGWRNYKDFTCSFAPGVNLLCGDNAQGKTNLIEAIGYLSQGSAFRTRKEAELIAFDAEFAELRASVFSQGRQQQLRAILFASRRPRQLYLNEVKHKTREPLQGVLSTVLFCPDDLLVLKKGAAERRKLLNDALCQLSPRYALALSEYSRVNLQKAAVLRDWRETPSLLNILPEYNEVLAKTGAELIFVRASYLRELERHATAFHREFSGGKEELRLIYHTVSTIDDIYAPKRQLYEKLREHQQSHLQAEKEAMQCLSGPHKDDFDALLGELSIKAYGSQGQTRTAAVSIKLAERKLFEAAQGEEPVLLLDDVLSELDAGRQDFLLNHIRSGQVFITCCENDRVTGAGQTLYISHGTLMK